MLCCSHSQRRKQARDTWSLPKSRHVSKMLKPELKPVAPSSVVGPPGFCHARPSHLAPGTVCGAKRPPLTPQSQNLLPCCGPSLVCEVTV